MKRYRIAAQKFCRGRFDPVLVDQMEFIMNASTAEDAIAMFKLNHGDFRPGGNHETFWMPYGIVEDSDSKELINMNGAGI